MDALDINKMLISNFEAPLASKEHLQNLAYSAVANALFGTVELDKSKSLFCVKIAQFCIKNFIENKTLQKKEILALHKLIIPENYYNFYLKNSNKKELKIVTRGQFRDINTYLNINGFDIKFIDYRLINKEIDEMIQVYNNSDKTIEDIATILLEGFRIHPFMDGNGRVFRVLFDMLLLQNNYYPSFFNLSYKKHKEFFRKIFNYYIHVDALKGKEQFVESLTKIYKMGYFS